MSSDSSHVAPRSAGLNRAGMVPAMPVTSNEHDPVNPRGFWVTPGSDPRIEQAVVEGGGELVPLERARGVIVHRGGPTALDDIGPNVEWIQLPSAGIDNYIAAGVVTDERVTTNAGPAYADCVAEHVILLMLGVDRNMKAAMRASSWEKVDIRPLQGSTVLIVGAGKIGRAVIRRLGGFDVTIHASTRSGRLVPGASATVAATEEKALLPQADVVVIAAPATAETHHLVDGDFLRSMKPGAVLINVARGSLVDTDALVAALDSGQLGGAALDVTDPEPQPHGHPLWDHPRAIVTPHIANTIETSIPSLAHLIKQNVRRFLSGDELVGVVDPNLGY